MDIRIKTITLNNFKGIHTLTLEIGGKNARLEGDNGAGKSTVFDAFTWLLFGKDHAGQDWTNFDIKPIDPATGEAVHGLEHWVEAVLLIDGVETRLRRVIQEDWVKPRGQAERVLKGHKQQFFIDGIDTATKSAYDAAVHQWIDEGVFKMLTNPLHFIDDRYTGWQDRRKAIVALVGDPGRDAALQEQFADLVAQMEGRPLDQFRKLVAAQRRDNKAELDKATANVSAWKQALPEPVDSAELDKLAVTITSQRDAEIATIRAGIKALDDEISSATSAAAGKRAAVDAKNREILALNNKMGEYVSEQLKATRNEKEARNRAIFEAQQNVAKLELEKRDLERAMDEDKRKVMDYSIRRADEASHLAALGERYEALRKDAFKYDGETVCPHCGRPYDAEQVEGDRAARLEKYNADRKATMDKIIAEADGIKEEIRKIDTWIVERQEAEQAKEEKAAAIEPALQQARAELLEAEGAPDPDMDEAEKQALRTPAYKEMAEQELRLSVELESLASEDDGTRDLLAERRKLEADIQVAANDAARKLEPINAKRTVNAERDRLLKMISDEEARAAVLADEVARLERLEFRASEYVKAGIDAMDGAIRALFHVARWKMFSTTLDGGLQDMCEVMSPDGVPYRSMNDAMKTLCGMDVIRVFSERYDCTAPIFIDNAESITRTDFGTAAQVIRLVVTPGADKLRLVREGTGE